LRNKANFKACHGRVSPFRLDNLNHDGTYFRGAAVNDILAELKKELTMFSLAAAEACKKYNLNYPGHTETAVRRHLNDMGALLRCCELNSTR
jgi:hypothetical protein